ncbi:MAG: hypothetical protein Q7K03_12405 [Dehalococcoidia bacterium]|nr:hypothetical protein [Dehalococcoidia bacterium]
MLKRLASWAKGASKQRVIPKIGEFKETLSQVLFWGSILNYFMMAGTFYYTTLRFVLPWFDLPKFAVALTLGGLAIFFVEYKWVVPSIWAFRGKQMDMRNSDEGKMDAILEKLGALERRIPAQETHWKGQDCPCALPGVAQTAPGHPEGLWDTRNKKE